ncbi:MAG: hypothetical protein II540_01670 [Paludibacteraceae bacterium]|nr:hypothetical protein [Paludibacteraceae bacterium]
MKKTLFIGLVVLLSAACSTTDVPPLDDAYIWAEKTQPSSTPGTHSSSSTSSSSSVSTPDTIVKPGMHILYEKDTTITVRIIR